MEYARKLAADSTSEVYVVAPEGEPVRATRRVSIDVAVMLPFNSPAVRQEATDRDVFSGLDSEHVAPTQDKSPMMRRKIQTLPLSHQPWFRSGLSRSQVDETLHDAAPGTFLVRDSSQPGSYALSVKEAGPHIAHLLIVPVTVSAVTRYKLGEAGERLFDTVPDLIRHFVEHPYAPNRKLVSMDGARDGSAS